MAFFRGTVVLLVSIQVALSQFSSQFGNPFGSFNPQANQFPSIQSNNPQSQLSSFFTSIPSHSSGANNFNTFNSLAPQPSVHSFNPFQQQTPFSAPQTNFNFNPNPAPTWAQQPQPQQTFQQRSFQQPQFQQFQNFQPPQPSQPSQPPQPPRQQQFQNNFAAPAPSWQTNSGQQQQQTNRNNNNGGAPVHYVDISPKLNGDYKFGYHTGGKGSDAQSFREETRLPDGTVKGAYGYVDANGKQRIVRYTAGKDGYKAEGDISPDEAPAAPQPQPAPQPQQPQPQRQQSAPQQQFQSSNGNFNGNSNLNAGEGPALASFLAASTNGRF